MQPTMHVPKRILTIDNGKSNKKRYSDCLPFKTREREACVSTQGCEEIESKQAGNWAPHTPTLCHIRCKLGSCFFTWALNSKGKVVFQFVHLLSAGNIDQQFMFFNNLAQGWFRLGSFCTGICWGVQKGFPFFLITSCEDNLYHGHNSTLAWNKAINTIDHWRCLLYTDKRQHPKLDAKKGKLKLLIFEVPSEIGPRNHPLLDMNYGTTWTQKHHTPPGSGVGRKTAAIFSLTLEKNEKKGEMVSFRAPANP